MEINLGDIVLTAKDIFNDTRIIIDPQKLLTAEVSLKALCGALDALEKSCWRP